MYLDQSLIHYFWWSYRQSWYLWQTEFKRKSLRCAYCTYCTVLCRADPVRIYSGEKEIRLRWNRTMYCMYQLEKIWDNTFAFPRTALDLVLALALSSIQIAHDDPQERARAVNLGYLAHPPLAEGDTPRAQGTVRTHLAQLEHLLAFPLCLHWPVAEWSGIGCYAVDGKSYPPILRQIKLDLEGEWSTVRPASQMLIKFKCSRLFTCLAESVLILEARRRGDGTDLVQSSAKEKDRAEMWNEKSYEHT